VEQLKLFREKRCHWCKGLFFICPPCDRGHGYCRDRCRELGRRAVRRRIRAFHQATEDGRADHRDRNRKVEVGQKVGIKGSTIPWVIITSLRPLTGEHGGKRYRVPRRMLGEVL